MATRSANQSNWSSSCSGGEVDCLGKHMQRDTALAQQPMALMPKIELCEEQFNAQGVGNAL